MNRHIKLPLELSISPQSITNSNPAMTTSLVILGYCLFKLLNLYSTEARCLVRYSLAYMFSGLSFLIEEIIGILFSSEEHRSLRCLRSCLVATRPLFGPCIGIAATRRTSPNAAFRWAEFEFFKLRFEVEFAGGRLLCLDAILTFWTLQRNHVSQRFLLHVIDP